MNIVISLDCPPDLVDAIVSDIHDVLSTRGLAAHSTEIGNLSVLHASPLADLIPAEDPPAVGCGVCQSDPCICSPVDDSILGTEQGLVAMVNVPPINQEIGMDIPPMDIPPEPAPSFGDVRILTLSTSFHIPSSVVGQNTVLKTTGRILSDGVVRFTFNGFEHALPVADMADRSIVNVAHTSGPSTVRLVIDIANKTYACLVDVEGGDKEELLIGEDLLAALKEPVANVPAE